jgi:hypothetical protein
MKSVPATFYNAEAHLRLVVNALNELAGGKINATSTVTLIPALDFTTVTYAFVGPDSTIVFEPQTANAAAELAAGTMYTSAKGQGAFTITHANNGQTDRTFSFAVLGGAYVAEANTITYLNSEQDGFIELEQGGNIVELDV